jgi:hypothetical protein
MLPQPVPVATSVGAAPHTPATQVAPASHWVPHSPQLLGSDALSVHTPFGPPPTFAPVQISGLFVGQEQTISLQKKPPAGQSAVFMQATSVLAPPPEPDDAPPEPD